MGRDAEGCQRERNAVTARAFPTALVSPDELSRFDDSLDIVLIGCVTVTVKVACDRTFAFVRFTRQRGIDDTMRLIRT